MSLNKKTFFGIIFCIFIVITSCTTPQVETNRKQERTVKNQGNVIFIHPDGTTPSHWGAARMLHYGPDGFYSLI